MNQICKGLALVLSALFLFTLCLTPAVFATEGVQLPAPGISATPPLKDSGAPPTPTAATADELLDWLYENEDVGGTLLLTGDISLCDVSYTGYRGAQPVTIDTGEFSILATGEVDIISDALTIRGKGGERGVLRAAEGSKLALSYLTVTADEGYAVFQEEGAGFAAEECTITGNIHYADTPFVWSWKQGLAVVKPGGLAADALPDTLSVTINLSGATNGPEEVPVTWELAGHEEAQENRQRFTAEGVFEGLAFSTAPGCTVVYDDYPLTFLLVSGKKLPGGRGENYQFTGKFSMPEDRLPIMVAQEFSFDGENWRLCEEKDFPSSNIAFNMLIPGRDWDTERNPAIFIRMRWDDAGTMYYSNVLCFAADNLAEGEDHGGNRGGGTDITEPPTVPVPDPPEDGDGNGDGDGLPNPPPDPPEGGNGNGDGDGLPNPTPDPPEGGDGSGDGDGLPNPTPDPPEDGNGSGDGNTLPSAPNRGSGGRRSPSLFSPEPAPDPPSATVTDTSGNTPQVIPATGNPPADAKKAPAQPKAPQAMPEGGASEAPARAVAPNPPLDLPQSVEAGTIPEPGAAPKGPGALSIAVGCAAAAGCIGAAGLYLHPQALKKLLELLRNMLPKK